jgi:hypothetical protein
MVIQLIILETDIITTQQMEVDLHRIKQILMQYILVMAHTHTHQFIFLVINYQIIMETILAIVVMEFITIILVMAIMQEIIIREIIRIHMDKAGMVLVQTQHHTTLQ